MARRVKRRMEIESVVIRNMMNNIEPIIAIDWQFILIASIPIAATIIVIVFAIKYFRKKSGRITTKAKNKE
jgi:hypothetical protein